MKMTDTTKALSFVVGNIPEKTTKADLSEELTRCVRGDGSGVNNEIQYILYPLAGDYRSALVNFSKYPGE